MKLNGPGIYKLEQGGKCWQWVKHAWIYSDLLQDFKGDNLTAPRASVKGP